MDTSNDEIWKNLFIIGFSKYDISNLGRLRNAKTKRILRCSDNGHGYAHAILPGDDGKKHVVRRARLVAFAFVKNPDPVNKKYVDHIDTNRMNDKASNLHWVTASENSQNPITRQKQSLAQKGKVISESTKQKIRDIWANRTEEERKEIGKKVSDAITGRSLSEEHKKHISETLKNKYKDQVSPMKDKPLSEEHKKNISIAMRKAAEKRRAQNNVQ